jgi:hypothetical protein
MRNAVASLVIIGLFSSPAAAGQARGSAAGKPAMKACSLLTKELVMKVSGAVNKAVFNLPPEEGPAGAGTICDYADITLQIDAFAPEVIERTVKEQSRGASSARKANWVPVSGVGDRAYFDENDRNFAALMGYVNGHTFTIQMSIPFQSTAEKMKPNVIALANAIVPKLK